MSRTVFILGAGASKEAGAPLMNNFYDVAYELRRSNNCGGKEATFDLVFKANNRLRGVYEKSYLSRTNIEDIFSAIEMGRIVGRLGSLTPDEIEETSRAIRIFIATTLERTMHYPFDGSFSRPWPRDPYWRFAERLESIERMSTASKVESAAQKRCSIITFNYDLAMEVALYSKNITFDYCLADQPIPSAIPYLKLHGSLNWAKCEKCGKIVWNDIWRQEYPTPPGSEPILVHGNPDKAMCCEGKQTEVTEPAIIPPIWNKTQTSISLINVWKRAAKELSEAEDIIIMGYSLPNSDLFFRYLFALGTDSETPLKHFIVMDPDESLKTKFTGIIGRGIESRYIYRKHEFGSAIENLIQLLTH